VNDKHYDLNKIREKFDSYRQGPNPEMGSAEFEEFCSTIQVLPRDIIDKIQREIWFIYIYDYKCTANIVPPAWYIKLKQERTVGKEGIIFITSYVLGTPTPPVYIEEHCARTILNPMNHPVILHEIAHHILGHSFPRDRNEMDAQHKKVGELVEKWLFDYAASPRPDED
jgi:hypothetical protein